MSRPIVSQNRPIALIGGGQLSAQDLRDSETLCHYVVGVDGGASLAMRGGVQPDCVIGDLDSITSDDLARFADGDIHHFKDQNTTDFDKALRSVAAPLILAFGFNGARLDHELAALHTVTAHPDKRCILVGAETITFLCPPAVTLDIPPTDAFSLFPMGAVTGQSTGLKWPINDIVFAPDTQVGTSNASVDKVTLTMDAPKMLVLLPRRYLGQVMTALSETPAHWPARGK